LGVGLIVPSIFSQWARRREGEVKRGERGRREKGNAGALFLQMEDGGEGKGISRGAERGRKKAGSTTPPEKRYEGMTKKKKSGISVVGFAFFPCIWGGKGEPQWKKRGRRKKNLPLLHIYSKKKRKKKKSKGNKKKALNLKEI